MASAQLCDMLHYLRLRGWPQGSAPDFGGAAYEGGSIGACPIAAQIDSTRRRDAKPAFARADAAPVTGEAEEIPAWGKRTSSERAKRISHTRLRTISWVKICQIWRSQQFRRTCRVSLHRTAGRRSRALATSRWNLPAPSCAAREEHSNGSP